MRISRLEIQAFGPFAGREVIDFDELSSQGLFLLNGPTGAGKTSVLDAVCFALYGSVPGARQDGKRLRSDHAEAATAPEVLCRFTASGRTFEVVRSPAWQRPSARAAKGTTPEQAKTLLRELVDGVWEVKSTRNDEAAQEIIGLLGMNAKQFTRVVMLPQGQFAAFLRSDAKDRQELLQQLFGTERFKSVEEQLVDDAAQARQQLRDAESNIGFIMRKAADEAAKYAETPEAGVQPETGVEPAAGGELEAGGDSVHRAGADFPGGEEQQLEHWLAEASSKVEVAAKTSGQARNTAQGARTEHQDLADRLTRFRKLEAARNAETALDGQRADHHARLERRRFHRAAELLHGRLQAVDNATASLEECSTESGRLLRSLMEHPLLPSVFSGRQPASAQDPGLEAIETAKTEMDARLAVLEAQIPKEKELQDKEHRLAQLDAKETELAAAEEKATRRSEELDREIATASSRLEEHREVAGTLSHVSAEEERAKAVVAAVAERGRMLQQDKELTNRHQQLRQEHLDTKEHWLNLLRKRLEHAAGELAASLDDGAPCPVCGSTDHPQPSELVEAVRDSDRQEEEAKQEQEAAETRLQEAADALQAVRQQVAVLTAQGGDADPEEAAAAASAATSAAAAAAEAASRQQSVAAELETLRTEAESLRGQARQLSNDVAQTRAASKALQENVTALDGELRAARDGHATLQERVGTLQDCSRLMGKCLEGMRKEATAAEHLASVSAELNEAVDGSAFDTASVAREALLTPSEVEATDRKIDEYEAEQHRVRAALDDESVVRAARESDSGTTAPEEAEVSRLGARVEAAAAAAEEAVVAHRMLESSRRYLQRLQQELADALAEAGPVREHSRQLGELADLVRGTGENSYRMTLNTYVLAARLEQVAICATERLATMTSDRYGLVYDDSRAARNAKSGLGLQVVDEWTGQARDTSTLSGGESFMASLALALGLADVVQQESGGVDIETLFVDEGFGSLDEEALEQVMDALEGLRDGGRVVGLVSHVPEMKQRIPAQLQVLKDRNGSTLQVRQLEPAG
ncbi:sbcc family protein [Arthrobacter pigmenti]